MSANVVEWDAYKERLEAAGGDAERAVILNREAAEAAKASDVERAFALAERAAEFAHAAGSLREVGRSEYTLAMCEYLRAEYASAHKRALDCSVVAEGCNDSEGFASAMLIAAACLYQMGALEEAHSALLQVLDIVADWPDEESSFRAHNMIGTILSDRQEYERAQEHFDLAIAAGTRMGSEFYLQRARVNRASLGRKMATAQLAAGAESEALENLQAAAYACEAIRSVAQHVSSRENAAGCAGVLGEVYLQLGRADEALALFDEMLQYGVVLENLLLQSEALLHMGRIFTSRNEHARACDCLERALEKASRANARRMMVDVHEAIALVFESSGDVRQALDRYRRYHQLSEELLRSELAATSRARRSWADFLRARGDAKTHKERFESLAKANEELAKRSSHLAQAAFEDALTGLSNRRHLDLRLAELVASMDPNQPRLAVAILDIDNFKQINDRFTHRAGDEVLSSVATMIRTYCREGDVSARFGGDEFVICFIGTSIEGARVTVERLRGFVEAYDWNTVEEGVSVTVSIGITQMRASDEARDLLARADAALYGAKHGGRNRTCVG